MAVRRQLTESRLVMLAESAGVGVLRIRAEDLERLEKHLFQRYPNREWGTFFRFGYRRTAWGVVICFVEALWPAPGELDRQSDITKFHAEYSRRAFHASASAEGLAIGVAHSHPVGCPTTPSFLDDDMDEPEPEPAPVAQAGDAEPAEAEAPAAEAPAEEEAAAEPAPRDDAEAT